MNKPMCSSATCMLSALSFGSSLSSSFCTNARKSSADWYAAGTGSAIGRPRSSASLGWIVATRSSAASARLRRSSGEAGLASASFQGSSAAAVPGVFAGAPVPDPAGSLLGLL
jgi:hypothetical protein